MKKIDLGMKSKKASPTADNPDHMIDVTHHPEMSFVAPHHLNLPKGKFHFGGHAELVAHDAREEGGAQDGNPKYTIRVHSLEMPHDDQHEVGDEGAKEAISNMMDKLNAPKQAN